MSLTAELKQRFMFIVPGQTAKLGEYVAKPKTSTWFRIEDLDEIRAFAKSINVNFVPRFRGPRTTTWVFDKQRGRECRRSSSAISGTCLKQDALFFSVSSRG